MNNNQEDNEEKPPAQLNQHGKPKQQVKLYKLTKQMIEQAHQHLQKDADYLPEGNYQEAKQKAKKVWDKFYKNHKCNFFKDRTYLEREIKEITYFRQKFTQEHPAVYIELGCGVGNTLFPILKQYPFFVCRGCDISSNAINLIEEEMANHLQDKQRLKVSVCDLVKDELPFQQEGDLISMIFVLSAIVPEKHQQVIKKIVRWMKPGSFFYFRDYGRYDFGQINMSNKGNRKLKDNFYMKNDGVCVYYFDQKQFEEMCVKAGLVKVEGDIHCRLLQNRKRGLKMHRVWVQCRFYKPPIDQFYLQKFKEEQEKQEQLEKLEENQEKEKVQE